MSVGPVTMPFADGLNVRLTRIEGAAAEGKVHVGIEVVQTAASSDAAPSPCLEHRDVDIDMAIMTALESHGALSESQQHELDGLIQPMVVSARD